MTLSLWQCFMLLSGLRLGSAADLYLTNGDQSVLFERQPNLKFNATASLVLPGGSPPLAFDPAPTIAITDSVSYQSILGFGAHLTESAAYNFMQLSSAKRSDTLNALFGNEGARFRVVAINIGSSDFSLSSYTYADIQGPADNLLQYFSIERDRYYVISMLQAIKAIRPGITVMARPWSPPAWMKDSNSPNGGSLLPQYFSTYADYLVAYAKAYKAEGLQIDFLSILNEPQFSTGDYPSTSMSAADQVQVLKLTRAAFDSCGPTLCGNVGLIGYEHNWDTPDYPLTVLSDAEARAAIAGTAWHCYGGDESVQSTVHDQYPSKDIFFTECTGGDWSTNFGSNLAWNTKNIFIESVRNWARVGLLWNLALSEAAGPTNGGCKNCRGVITVKADGTVQYNEEFYALKHSQKFVQRLAVRIDSDSGILFGSTDTSDYIHSVAYKNPDGSITVVIVNESTTTSTPVNIWLKGSVLTVPQLNPQSVATVAIPA